MPKQSFERRFAQVVDEERLLAPDEPVVVGVSGGPDSVAMLHLLCGLNGREGHAHALHVAHVNHRLRGGDSDADAEFVCELARRLNVPCTIESADVAARAQERGLSIEQAGRDCRFDFFSRLCLKTGAKAVALAHHADDNAETVLHRILRGTGLRGLVGIRPVRPLCPGSEVRVVRPMLRFRRSEIEAYLATCGIEYRQDASNLLPTHTRNRIRHDVLPLLSEQINPQVSEALLRLAEQARGLDAYITETCDRMMESLVIERDDRSLVLHSPSLVRKPLVIQTQLIRQAILQMGLGEGELTYGHLSAVADLAAGSEGSKALDLPAGLRVTRRYSRLVFERPAEAPAAEVDEARVATQGATRLPGRGLEIAVDTLPADEKTIAAHIASHATRHDPPYEEWLDADRVHPPLIARSRRPGDRFFPLGMTGMKKLSDFFIDEKIDADQRERATVLCDQLGPIWIVPFRIDERVRLTRATRRILRVCATPIPGPEA